MFKIDFRMIDSTDIFEFSDSQSRYSLYLFPFYNFKNYPVRVLNIHIFHNILHR